MGTGRRARGRGPFHSPGDRAAIKFIGVGEKYDRAGAFHADRIVSPH